MRPPDLVVPALAVALLALAGTGARAAALADLPRYDPARASVTLPGWRADRIELRLRPAAARQAVPWGTRTPGSTRALGLAGVDALAAGLEVALAPEFAGEFAPESDEGSPDLTAYWIASLPPGLDLADALARFAALPEVESASPIAVVPVSALSHFPTPADSLFEFCTWLDQYPGPDLRALEAWGITLGDTAVMVAVLDTGVLPYHPDLGGMVAGLSGNLAVNRVERAGVAGVDDDGNGVVDDIAGWDFVALGSGAGVVAGEDWADADPDPNDFAGHGTQVAGLIGALSDGAIGLVGVARRVRVLPVRVGWAETAFPEGVVDMAYVAQGIRYATRRGARVINGSFSTVTLPGLQDAVSAATRAGALVVMAAGNNGQTQDLGLRDDVLAVAAVDGLDAVTAFSNQGAWVDVAAPGLAMRSTSLTHAGADSLGLRQPDYANGLAGTSYSAPLVSGGVALLQAYRRLRHPTPLTTMGALLRVRDTAHDVDALQPPGTRLGTGRLDLMRLLTDRPTSLAVRAGALAVGAPVALRAADGRVTLVYTTQNQRLLFLDATTGDTVRVMALGGVPARQLAAADMGGGLGVCLFAGLRNGRIAGFDATGNVLAGFPVFGPSTVFPFEGGPALGDLDGDGVLEVVCGGPDGAVYAWGPDGQPRDGFPVVLGPSLGLPVALAALDGTPGLEIVAVTDDGQVHVVDGAGLEAAGFPVPIGTPAVAPVVTRFDVGAPPLVLVAAADTLRGLRADGSTHFRTALGGTVAHEPALADLDGDQLPEIVVALTAPAALTTLDSAGAVRAARGWPAALGGAAAGAPVVGRILPGWRAAVLVHAGGALMAYDDSARAAGRFPMPGGAGRAPTLGDFDADGATEVAAGSGADSTLYLYDAGPASADPTPMWTTARGDAARTGTLVAAPLPLAVEPPPVAPARWTLEASPRPSSGPVRLAWTGPAGERAVIDVLDVTGRRVRAPFPVDAARGALQWDGRDARGGRLPAGLYFARLTSGSFRVQTRVALIP